MFGLVDDFEYNFLCIKAKNEGVADGVRRSNFFLSHMPTFWAFKGECIKAIPYLNKLWKKRIQIQKIKYVFKFTCQTYIKSNSETYENYSLEQFLKIYLKNTNLIIFTKHTLKPRKSR